MVCVMCLVSEHVAEYTCNFCKMHRIFINSSIEKYIRFLHDYIAGLASNSLMRSDILEREGSSRETMQPQLTTYV